MCEALFSLVTRCTHILSSLFLSVILSEIFVDDTFFGFKSSLALNHYSFKVYITQSQTVLFPRFLPYKIYVSYIYVNNCDRSLVGIQHSNSTQATAIALNVFYLPLKFFQKLAFFHHFSAPPTQYDETTKCSISNPVRSAISGLSEHKLIPKE